MKTVYILGAGFSITAGAPPQERIVKEIFDLHNRNPHVFGQDKIDNFKSFLTQTLCIPEAEYDKVPLEDIFTPLDKCIVDNLSFRDKSIDDVREIRKLIYFLIGKTLQEKLNDPYTKKGYIDKFAKHIVETAKTRARGGYKSKIEDKIAIISTNWDILLDNSLKTHIDTQYSSEGVVDYCCYISSYHLNDTTVKPGLEKLGEGGFNVKYIKLHGSMNWLQCPRCLRIYVDFHNKIAIEQYTIKSTCRHCDKNFNKCQSHTLTPILIMPTFLKDLSNPQYRIIWQNAGIEISEADKLVFIGYSLPFADFEMRQLLSRMTRQSAKIEVVDFGPNNPKTIETINRFKVFFGDRELTTFLGGAEEYIKTNF